MWGWNSCLISRVSHDYVWRFCGASQEATVVDAVPVAECQICLLVLRLGARQRASRCRCRRPRCLLTPGSRGAWRHAAHSTVRSAVTAATPAARTTGRASYRRTHRIRRRWRSRDECLSSISSRQSLAEGSYHLLHWLYIVYIHLIMYVYLYYVREQLHFTPADVPGSFIPRYRLCGYVNISIHMLFKWDGFEYIFSGHAMLALFRVLFWHFTFKCCFHGLFLNRLWQRN